MLCDLIYRLYILPQNQAPVLVQAQITELRGALLSALEQETRIIVVGAPVDSDQEDFVEVDRQCRTSPNPAGDNVTVAAMRGLHDEAPADEVYDLDAANMRQPVDSHPSGSEIGSAGRSKGSRTVTSMRVGDMTVMTDRMVFARTSCQESSKAAHDTGSYGHNPPKGRKISSDRQQPPPDQLVGAEEETRDEILARVPVVPYGLDLEYWGKEDTVVLRTGMLCVLMRHRMPPPHCGRRPQKPCGDCANKHADDVTSTVCTLSHSVGSSHDAARFWAMTDVGECRIKTAADLGLTQRTTYVTTVPKVSCCCVAQPILRPTFSSWTIQFVTC